MNNSNLLELARGLAPGSGAHDCAFNDLIDHLTLQIQAGDEVDLDALIATHPEHAERLRRLVPSMQALAELGNAVASGSVASLSAIQAAGGNPLPGILGDFRILREIGRGGMGVVYEAEQISLNRRVALKVLPFAAMLDPRALQRFKNEAQAAALVDHPNIVDIYGVGAERGVHYYAMRLIDGRTLAEAIQEMRTGTQLRSAACGRQNVSETETHVSSDSAVERPPSSTPADLTLDYTPQPESTDEPPAAQIQHSKSAVPTLAGAADDTRHSGTRNPKSTSDRAFFHRVASWGFDIAEALHRAHQQGVIHRDVKPSNLLVDNNGKIWIADFGLAHIETAGSMTMTGDLLGTLRYMSPEQVQGNPADARSDIYALGVTLYEALTLEPAVAGGDRQSVLRRIASEEPRRPRQVNKSIPAELETIILKSIAASPAERYATAQDLADDLRRYLKDQPIKAKPATFWQRAAKLYRRNKAVTITGGIGIALTLLVIAAAALTQAAAAQSFRSTTAREVQRETVIQELQLIRYRAHEEGWFTKAWNRIEEGARIRGGDVLRDQAVAALEGLDAVPEKKLDNFGASSVAFNPDGRQFIIGGTRGSKYHASRGATLWQTEGYELFKTSPHADFGPVTFRGATPLQLVSHPGPSLQLWDVGANAAIQEFRIAAAPDDPAATGFLLNAFGYPVTAISQNGNWIAAAVSRADGKDFVAAWDAASGKQVLLQAASARVLAFSPGKRLLAAADKQGHVFVWSLENGSQLASFAASRTVIHTLAFSPDGRRLAVGGHGGLLTIWDWAASIPTAFCRGSQYDVFSVAFSPDGVTLASAGRDRMRLWDVVTGRQLLSLGYADFATALAFSPDGSRLACSREPGFAEVQFVVWKLDYGRGIQALRGLDTVVQCAWFSSEDKLLAALCQDWQLGVYELGTGRLLHIFHPTPGVTSDNAAVAFSPDGLQMAFSAGQKATLWDLKTGGELKTWTLPPGLQDQLVFPSAERLLLVRMETKGMQAPPYGDSDPREHPRVCRVRNLLAAEPLRAITEITQFDRQIFPILATRDGKHFAVRGWKTGEEKPRHVAVFETETGQAVWSYTAEEWIDEMRMDPIGTVLGLIEPSPIIDRDSGRRGPSISTLVQLPSGRFMKRITNEKLRAVGPGADYLATHHDNTWTLLSGYGFRLFHRDAKAPVAVLRIDNETIDPWFGCQGRLLATGNQDGSVSVYDLHEVNRRLTSVGMGW